MILKKRGIDFSGVQDSNPKVNKPHPNKGDKANSLSLNTLHVSHYSSILCKEFSRKLMIPNIPGGRGVPPSGAALFACVLVSLPRK